MTPEQINIAIAEHCGLPINICHCGDGPDATIHSVRCDYAHMFSPMADTPDYYHDLNAMHEAEASFMGPLGQAFVHEYNRELRLLHLRELQYGDTNAWRWHMKASQKAEAFLRAVGKWEDNKQ